MSEEFKIHGAVRYKGRAYVSGKEKELLEAGFNPAEELDRIKEREGRFSARDRIRGERSGNRIPVAEAEAEAPTQEAPEQEDDTPLHEVRVQDLRGRLAKVTDPAEVRRLQDADDRVTAQTLYAARLEELQESGG